MAGHDSLPDSLRELLRRKKDGTFKDLLRDWKWIFSYTRRYRGAVFLYLLFGILSTTLTLAASVASKYTIDIITGQQKERLPFVITVMVLSAILGVILNAVVSRVSAKVSIRVGNDIQAQVFDMILDTDWLSVSRYPGGELLNRFNADVGSIASNAISWLPDLIITLYSLIATFLVIFYYNHIMALIAVIAAPVLLFTSRPLLRQLRGRAREVKEANGRMMSFETESFANLDTIKGFGLTELYGRRLRTEQEDFKKKSLDYNLFSVKTEAFLSILGSAVRLAGFGYCLYLLWSGKILYGTMTLFLSQSAKLMSSFNSLARSVPGFLNGAVSAARVRELTELPKEHHAEASEPVLSGPVSVRFENVDFSYDSHKPVLAHACFRADPGEIVALIGPSGEGKTTMIRLLLGLVLPASGSVTLSAGGKTVPVGADVRSLFSYVPQGNTVLSGTVADNLRMVRENASDAELEAALKVACAWDFVSAMPGGLNAPVGERGKGLSEGQAQRIAIARAILRDAPVLLLDESTCSLDPDTEKSVLRNILTSCPDKTCIVTTHRGSVLRLCSRVYRVSEGSLREDNDWTLEK